jgi:hypothetical protein
VTASLCHRVVKSISFYDREQALGSQSWTRTKTFCLLLRANPNDSFNNLPHNNQDQLLFTHLIQFLGRVVFVQRLKPSL